MPIAATLAIPSDQIDLYSRLPMRERQRVNTLLAAFAEIAAAEDIVGTTHRVARRLAHLGRGHSAKRIYSLYRAWQNGGNDWRILVRNWRNASAGLPAEFVRHWVGLVADSPRADSGRAAYDELLRAWFSDESIPGYGRLTTWWPLHRAGTAFPRGVGAPRPGDTPEGWSYENLMRQLPKRRATRKLMRQGFHAAHGDLMQLLRDRTHLRAMELVTFDDVRLDLQAIYDIHGKPQCCYVNAIFALCVGTGKVIAYGTKPRYTKDDDTHAGLSRAETRHLVCNILERYGLPEHPTHLLLENAAAALTGDDRSALEATFPNRLNIETTGMVRRNLLAGGFTEQGGMPWQKGWIEAYFRGLQARVSLLPGSTGNRYDNDPGDLAGRLTYTRQLLRHAQAHPEHADRLIYPVLQQHELEGLLAEIVERLNYRTRHNLQGFEQLTEYRIDGGPWQPIASMYSLAPEARLAAEIHQRMESPAERWNRLAASTRWQAIHPSLLMPLAADKKTVRPRNGEVRLGHDRYDGRAILEEKHEGQQLFAFLSADHDTLHLFTPAPALAYIASIHRQTRINPLDTAAINTEAGRVHQSRQADIATAAEYQSRQALELNHMRAHNAATMQSPLSAAADAMHAAENTAARTRAKATALRKADLAATDLLDDEDTHSAHADVAAFDPNDLL
jgi:hypothetical protein